MCSLLIFIPTGCFLISPESSLQSSVNNFLFEKCKSKKRDVPEKSKELYRDEKLNTEFMLDRGSHG